MPVKYALHEFGIFVGLFKKKKTHTSKTLLRPPYRPVLGNFDRQNQ